MNRKNNYILGTRSYTVVAVAAAAAAAAAVASATLILTRRTVQRALDLPRRRIDIYHRWRGGVRRS